MGQFWIFANLDKKQTTGRLGKLGEFYGTYVPSTIVWLLAAPPKPIGGQGSDCGFGSWVGDRVICLGDYTDSLPDGVLTETERISDLASTPYSHISTNYKKIRTYRASESMYPDCYDWVLRNLTKNEFVRASAITLGNNPGQLHSHPGLGQALMTLTCWSDDPSTSMRVNFNITRGRWAGDRIDVRPLIEVEEEIDEGWTDISKAVSKRICDNSDEIY